MVYYHCSPVSGLKKLQPGKPKAFDKPAAVYMTTSLPMALMYGVRNFEYTYGYNKEGQIYYVEHFPNALAYLYKGKSASLYICAPNRVSTTKIPNEAVTDEPVQITEEKPIADVYEALLEQERTGALVIYRYEDLSDKMLAWIHKVERNEIQERNLLELGGPMAEYMKEHYPECWAEAEKEREMP